MCPLVHPFPSFVPIPNNRPLIVYPVYPNPVNWGTESKAGEAPSIIGVNLIYVKCYTHISCTWLLLLSRSKTDSLISNIKYPGWKLSPHNIFHYIQLFFLWAYSWLYKQNSIVFHPILIVLYRQISNTLFYVAIDYIPCDHGYILKIWTMEKTTPDII